MKTALNNIDKKINLKKQEIKELEGKVNSKGRIGNFYESVINSEILKDINLDLSLVKSARKIVAVLTAICLPIAVLSPTSPVLLTISTLGLSIYSFYKLNKIDKDRKKKKEDIMLSTEKKESNKHKYMSIQQAKEIVKKRDQEINDLYELRNKLTNTIKASEKNKIKLLRK